MGAAGVKSRPTEEPREDPLERALEDASVLLWFATREGKKVSEGARNAILDVESHLKKAESDPKTREEGLSRKDVGRLWAAYWELAAAVQPASVESILSTCELPFGQYGRGKWKFGNARDTKRWYTMATVAVLIGLLSIQTYWFAITVYGSDLERHRDELDRISGSLRLMNVLVEQQDSILNTPLESEITTSLREMLSNQPELAATVIQNQDPKDQLLTVLRLSLDGKTYRLQRVAAMLSNDMAILSRILPTDDENDEQSPSGPAPPSEQDNVGDRTGKPEDDPHLRLSDYRTRLQREQKNVNSLINTEELEVLLSTARSTTEILSQYFLPMLYGLLGSLAYIMRTLSREIQDVTFTRGSASRYSLRWPLGMLAGVTVGLFFAPTEFSGLAAITPLSVAFLAGYGVELLFTGLDRLVYAFTGRGPEWPKPDRWEPALAGFPSYYRPSDVYVEHDRDDARRLPQSSTNLEQYDGRLMIRLSDGEWADEEWKIDDQKRLVLSLRHSPDREFGLELAFSTGPDDSEALEVPVHVATTNTAPNQQSVIFAVQLDSDLDGLDDCSMEFEAPLQGRSKPVRLKARLPKDPGQYHVWVQIFQKRRLVQAAQICLKFVEDVSSKSG